jgi:hypothetical protein
MDVFIKMKNGQMVSLYRLMDEETWPDWLRAAASIFVVAMIGAMMFLILWGTP